MQQKIKIGFEFEHKGNTYKVTHTQADNESLAVNQFLAIYIGKGENRDLTTYNGHIRHGDFRSDNALFEVSDGGDITEVHEATGAIGLSEATDEYRGAIFDRDMAKGFAMDDIGLTEDEAEMAMDEFESGLY